MAGELSGTGKKTCGKRKETPTGRSPCGKQQIIGTPNKKQPILRKKLKSKDEKTKKKKKKKHSIQRPKNRSHRQRRILRLIKQDRQKTGGKSRNKKKGNVRST